MIFYPQEIIKDELRSIDYYGIKFYYFYTPQYSLNPIIADVFVPMVVYEIVNKYRSMLSQLVFEGFVFNVWNNARQDRPESIYKEFYSINFQTKIVDLNVSNLDSKNIMYSLKEGISLILGEIYANHVDFTKDNFIKREWLRIRGNVCKTKQAQRELFVEDFKVLFGQSRGHYTIKNFNEANFHVDKFSLAKFIVGLKDLMMLWIPITNYFRDTWYKYYYLDKQALKVSEDVEYYGLIFIRKRYLDMFRSKYQICKIDKTGLFVFDNSVSGWQSVIQ